MIKSKPWTMICVLWYKSTQPAKKNCPCIYISSSSWCVGLLFQMFDGCARSNIYLLNDHLNKREWTYIFGACCMMTIFIPSFRNYRIWSFFGLIMITYTAWYMTIASVYYGQVTSPNPSHSSIHSMPNNLRWLLLDQMFHNHTRLSRFFWMFWNKS